MYRERPLTRLPGVACEVTASSPYRVLPDGCTDLIWIGGRLMVAGPDPKATVTGALGGPDRPPALRAQHRACRLRGRRP